MNTIDELLIELEDLSIGLVAIAILFELVVVAVGDLARTTSGRTSTASSAARVVIVLLELATSRRRARRRLGGGRDDRLGLDERLIRGGRLWSCV